MNEDRRKELEALFIETGKELLRIVGADVPPGGHISLNVWRDTVFTEIVPNWQDHQRTEETFFIQMEEPA